jgi:hypothetical protein
MSLQTFWRPDGLRSFVAFMTSHCRTFLISHTVRALSLDPIKRRIQMDRYNERARNKRQTDPEWTKNNRDKDRSARCRNSNWKEENRPRIVEYMRDIWEKRYAQDPVIKLRRFVHNSVSHAWFRECLPWKSHMPILYKVSVQHTCSSCVVSRHGGGPPLVRFPSSSTYRHRDCIHG